MPKGPKGEKHPTDVIGNAVKVMRIATGEEEDVATASSAAATLGSLGGKARAKSTTAEQRSAIARKASTARWGKK
jgi:hypothetical protein